MRINCPCEPQNTKLSQVRRRRTLYLCSVTLEVLIKSHAHLLIIWSCGFILYYEVKRNVLPMLAELCQKFISLEDPCYSGQMIHLFFFFHPPELKGLSFTHNAERLLSSFLLTLEAQKKKKRSKYLFNCTYFCEAVAVGKFNP